MRRMRPLFAFLFAILAFGLAFASYRVESPWVTAYEAPYVGETIPRLPVRIERDRHYEVELEVSREGYWANARRGVPLRVEVPVGEAFDGTAEGETVFFRVYRFRAMRGDVVSLRIVATPAFAAYRAEAPRLSVRRVPFEYAMYFIVTLGLRASAFALLLVAVALGVASPVAARRRSS